MPAPRFRLARIVLDTTDIERAIRFWTKALRYKVTIRHASFVSMRHPTDTRATRLGLQPTTEAKRARSVDDASPIHLEIFTDDMEREAKRLEKLGATRPKDWPYGDDDPNWIVMRDPDGHEFCLVQLPK